MESKQILFEHSTALSPLSDAHETLPFRKGFPLTILLEEGKSGYPMVLPGEQMKARRREVFEDKTQLMMGYLATANGTEVDDAV